MTVIQPNSITGINSITIQSGESLSIHKSDGSLLREIVSATGVGTFYALNVGTSGTVQNNGAAAFAGIVTANGGLRVGTAISLHSNGNAGFSGIITANSGIKVGTAITLHTNGNLGITGVMTASSYVGDGSNLTGVSAGEFFGNSVGVSTSKNVGIHTTNVNTEKIVGAANSFVGLYMGDGFIGFPTSLNRNGGYFIATTVNALSAGPVSLGSTMTLHGTWVIV